MFDGEETKSMLMRSDITVFKDALDDEVDDSEFIDDSKPL